MKKLLLIIFFMCIMTVSHSQQLSTSSFFEMHAVMHNPATTGILKQTNAGATYKTQWSGMPGGPQTGIVYVNTYLKKAKIGIGGYIFNDKTGPTSRTGVQLAYAYHIPTNETSTFSLGIEGRFQQFSFDKVRLQETLGANDPVLSGNGNRIKGDAGVGIAYTSSKLKIGASVSQIVQSKLNLYEGTGSTNESARHYRHYYLHGSYNIETDGETKITPNFLMIYLPNAPTEIQGGIRMEHKNLFWYGLTWRASQAWLLSAGLNISSKFNFGYSFDIYSTPLSVYDRGSNGHELMLRYQF